MNEADSYYNEGNSLAHSGQLEAAIEAYNRALKIEPTLEDATFNKKLLEVTVNMSKIIRFKPL